MVMLKILRDLSVFIEQRPSHKVSLDMHIAVEKSLLIRSLELELCNVFFLFCCLCWNVYHLVPTKNGSENKLRNDGKSIF